MKSAFVGRSFSRLMHSVSAQAIVASQVVAKAISISQNMDELPDIGHGGYRKRSKFGDKSKVFHPEQHRNYSRFLNSSTQKKEDRHDLSYAVACAKRVKRWLKAQGSFIDVPQPPAHIQEKIIFIRGMKDELAELELIANG